MKKRKLSVKKISILIILLIIIIAGGVVAYLKLTATETETNEITEVASIEAYGYTLREDATEYYKSLFAELEEVLSADEVDEERYAELVAQMFIADFFNLDNKISKNDVGGVQFVYSDYQDDFTSYATDSMYKSVESNIYNDRDQDLPVVASVEVTKTGTQSYTYGDNTDEEAYVFEFVIEYETDMDYQTSGTLILIHNGNKIEVASMSESS